jgi:hypothetical protein
MAFVFDEKTQAIRMPAGDTADIPVTVEWDGLRDGDAVVFAIFDPKEESGDLVVRSAELVDGCAVIRLCNHDTRDVPPGHYRWNLRIVTGPARDAEGRVIADECSDSVITVFETPPSFRLTRGGAYV